jgi:hypothetical protein
VQSEAQQNVQSRVIFPCGHRRYLGNLGIGTRLVHRFDAFPRKGLFPVAANIHMPLPFTARSDRSCPGARLASRNVGPEPIPAAAAY